MNKIKIVLVDDHELVRHGLAQILKKSDEFLILGEAEDGESGVRLAKELQPDVVLMDLNMPGLGGMEATKRILRACRKTKILIVTAVETEPFPSRLLQMGASGYVSKTATADELREAVRTVAKGHRYLNPKIAQLLALQRFDNKDKDSPFDTLSSRELEIVHMIIQGESSPDIAKKLFLSPKTINSYRYRVFKKLRLKNNVEITHAAAKYGIIKLDRLSSKVEKEAREA